jgi:hypothetical protein
MFAQCFQYMTDIAPLYLLSKFWPFLTLPAAAWCLISLSIPFKLLHVCLLFWLLAVTPIVGILSLGNDFSSAMATTIKVWSFTYIFSATGILVILAPSPEILRRVVIGLGIGTYVIMIVLWFGVPESAYGGGDLETKLFMIDPERGYRIYMPMFFGIMLVFYINRSVWIQFAWWKPLAIAVAFILLLAIYKQRAAIASVVLATIVGGALSLKRLRLAAFIFLGMGACIGGVAFWAQSSSMEIKSNLGGSLVVREVSVATAWNYISAEPARWMIGVGGTTRFGDVTVGKLFNNPSFFLADIGWLGVLFEYGAVGVTLMLLVYISGLYLALLWGKPGDALSQAFVDYIIYLLASSVVYSAVFTPGELMTIMALSYYHNYAFSAVSPPDKPLSVAYSTRPNSSRGKVLWPGRTRPGW